MNTYEILINSYYLKKIIIIAIVIMFFIVSLLFWVLIIHKIYVEIRERYLRRLKEAYISDINRKLIEPDYKIKTPSRSIHFEAFGDVIIDMLSNISGEMGLKVKKIAHEMNLAKFYSKKALRGSRLKRLSAIEKLGELKDMESKEILHYLLTNSKDREIIWRAIMALSYISLSLKDLTIINNALKDPLFMSSKFNEYIYTNIIKSFRNENKEEELLNILRSLIEDPAIPIMLKRDIIEACGSESYRIARDLIIDCFYQFSDIAEVKIAAIRALGHMGGPEVCKLIKESFTDTDWRVRVVASTYAHLCGEEVIEDLRRCLYDRNFYVRSNSAKSLSKLGEKGLKCLSEETKSSDRFVRDISQYILLEMKTYA